MPIYEYTCKACDHQFETIVTATRTPVCPECGSKKLEKAFSAFAVVGQQASAHQPGPACASCDSLGAGSCPLSG